MSKEIPLFSVVTAALINIVYLQDGLKSPFLMPIKIKPGMVVYLEGHGSDNFRVDFLTADYAVALRVHFQLDQNEITMNTFDGHQWDTEKRAAYQIRDPFLFYINATAREFNLLLGWCSAHYSHRVSLDNISKILISGGARNELFSFGVIVKGPEMQILDNWMPLPNTVEIGIIGTPGSNFTIDLMTNDSIALRLGIHRFYISRSSRVGGWVQGWGLFHEETDGVFSFRPGKQIRVSLEVARNTFGIKVNGMMLLRYAYRVDPRLMNLVRVEGLPDVRITYTTQRRETAEFIPCETDELSPPKFNCSPILTNALDVGVNVDAPADNNPEQNNAGNNNQAQEQQPKPVSRPTPKSKSKKRPDVYDWIRWGRKRNAEADRNSEPEPTAARKPNYKNTTLGELAETVKVPYFYVRCP